MNWNCDNIFVQILNAESREGYCGKFCKNDLRISQVRLQIIISDTFSRVCTLHVGSQYTTDLPMRKMAGKCNLAYACELLVVYIVPKPHHENNGRTN